MLETITPTFVRTIIKRIYWRVKRSFFRLKYIKKGHRVEFGYRFRFTRNDPYTAVVGSNTIVEDFNIWNAKNGDIHIGENGWFGLHNIITGPIDIGSGFSAGPYVSILGPRHPKFNYDKKEDNKTIIGKNVWIGTGSVVLFGVKIADNVVVSAGAVVTKDVPEGSFMAGNPAKDLSRLVGNAWRGNTEDE
jgi:acetyltransferase-like isoleucine patch superfamily enzyme